MTLTAWRFAMLSPELRACLGLHNLLALLLAALCHDLDHPGTTNAFQVASSTPLALCYSDRSVLEAHHAHCASRLLRETGVLGGLEPGAARSVRSALLEAIFRTDMAHHGEVVKAMQALPPGPPGAGRLPPPSGSQEEKQLVVSVLLHAADLHSPLVGPDLDRRLAAAIAEEFAAQGEAERQAGQPVSVVKADTPLAVAAMEVGFISFVIRPLFVELGKMVPDLGFLLARVDASIAMWTQLKAEASAGEGEEKATRLSQGPRRSIVILGAGA